MRFYSDNRTGSRKNRYIAVQADGSSDASIAVKRADRDDSMGGTWVYLSRDQALKVAAQILTIASKLEN